MNGRVIPGAATEPQVEGLSSADVRQAVDEAIRRGWLEMARRTLRVIVLMLTDLAAALGAAWAMLSLRTDAWPDAFGSATATWSTFVTAVCIQPLALSVSGAYRSGESRVSFVRVCMGLLLGVSATGMQAFLGGGMGASLPREALGLLAYVLWASIAIFAVRLVIDRGVSFAYSLGIGRRRALVVGSGEELQGVVEMLRDRNGADLRIMGRLSPTREREPGAIHAIAEIGLALEATDAQEVIVASAKLSFEALETLIHRCMQRGVVVSLAPKTLHLMGMQFESRQVRGGTLLRLRPVGLGFPQLAMKRTIDLTLSIVGLLLTWPLFLFIAIAIKLDSRGPVLFKQVRAGLGGRPFLMYKFRTMVIDADAMKEQLHHLNESGDPRLFKIRNDPRVTRVGRLLRKTSLDELPQLFNVLGGDMSLIGPRPFFPDDLQQYSDHHFERLAVLPGITGLWQVCGRSQVVDFEEVVRFDREYIDGWSVWLDIKILMLTFPAVMRRTGAF
ncbi:MAG TPA: sugar transferase [Longimicrobiaceae bacterium]|jgi:exopolysaccharide biosynthesis polyprenyl glycosylphosphotransferase